ncbi:MAG: peptidylprolyl isomerase [Synechococcus sp.]
MAQAKSGDVVLVHYTGTLDDGSIFDSSRDRDPLQVELGSGQVIAGFDEALTGMSPGDTKTQVIPCESAYGPHMADMAIEVDRKQVPDDVELVEGLQLQISGPNGQPIVVMVTEFDDLKVTLDANHPLAGKTLTFDLELIEIVEGQ